LTHTIFRQTFVIQAYLKNINFLNVEFLRFHILSSMQSVSARWCHLSFCSFICVISWYRDV